MDFSNLCTPAFIYFVISIIYLVINSLSNFNIISIAIKVFFIVVWSLFLNYLCSIGYTIISWIIILLPFLFF